MGPQSDLFGETQAEQVARRASVTAWLTEEAEPWPGADPVSDALTGTLVHRLFQLAPRLTQDDGDEASLSYANNLLRPEERASAPDVEAIVTASVGAWRRMREQPDVARVLTSGELLHEVPFSLADPDAAPPLVLRGTIDCLVRRRDGSVVVVEFKTGRRRPSHEKQLDVYVRAVQACHPGTTVERLLVYL